MIAVAAGIAAALTDAGMPTSVVSAWFDRPRRELAGLSPHAALEVTPTAQCRVLRLARADAAALAADAEGRRS